MSRPIQDLTGQTFGRLTVLERAEDYIQPNGRHRIQWVCECSCQEHNKVTVLGEHLKNKNTQSCGCLRKETASVSLYKLAKKYNQYDLTKKYGIGWTSNTNKEFYFDLEDYDKIKDYCWSEHIDDTGYSSLIAWDSELKKIIKMSYIIVGKYRDHKNRNPLDNRKENLRTATSAENAQNKSKRKNNTSGVIGVCWHKQKNMWESSITVDKRKLYLGNFYSKNDAIKTRLRAEIKYFGEFAPQKHLFEQYNIIAKEEGVE